MSTTTPIDLLSVFVATIAREAGVDPKEVTTEWIREMRERHVTPFATYCLISQDGTTQTGLQPITQPQVSLIVSDWDMEVLKLYD